MAAVGDSGSGGRCGREGGGAVRPWRSTLGRAVSRDDEELIAGRERERESVCAKDKSEEDGVAIIAGRCRGQIFACVGEKVQVKRHLSLRKEEGEILFENLGLMDERVRVDPT